MVADILKALNYLLICKTTITRWTCGVLVVCLQEWWATFFLAPLFFSPHLSYHTGAHVRLYLAWVMLSTFFFRLGPWLGTYIMPFMTVRLLVNRAWMADTEAQKSELTCVLRCPLPLTLMLTSKELCCIDIPEGTFLLWTWQLWSTCEDWEGM